MTSLFIPSEVKYKVCRVFLRCWNLLKFILSTRRPTKCLPVKQKANEKERFRFEALFCGDIFNFFSLVNVDDFETVEPNVGEEPVFHFTEPSFLQTSFRNSAV